MTERFETLAEMLEAHATLLEEVPDEHLSAEEVDRVESFLARGAATGSILDAAADRRQAQGLLDYWSASLLTAMRQTAAVSGSYSAAPSRSSEAVLAAFDVQTIDRIAADAERRIQSLSESTRELAERILVRLVRLEPSGRFAPVAVPLQHLNTLGDAGEIDRILNQLEESGAVRREKNAVRLSYEALTRSWTTLRDLLDDRSQFREAARYWIQSGEHDDALIRGKLLMRARSYGDLDDVERKFIDASGDMMLLRARMKKRLMVLCAVVASVISVIAIVGWVKADGQAKIAQEKTEKLKKKTKELKDKSDQLLEESKKLKQQKVRADKETVRADAQAKEAKAARDALQIRVALSEIVNITHTLATISFEGANPAEIKISTQRLEQQKRRLAETPDKLRDKLRIDEVVVRLNGLVAQLKNSQYDIDDEYKHDVLDLGRRVKNQAALLPDLKKELGEHRKTAYELVRFVTGEIVKSLEAAPYEAAGPLIREFWIMYWGQMGLFEGPDVQGGMVEFGQQLTTIDQSVRPDLPDLDKAFTNKQFKPFENRAIWQRAQIIQSNVLPEKDLSEFRELYVQISKVKVSPVLVKELSARAEALREVLEKESDESIDVTNDVLPPAKF